MLVQPNPEGPFAPYGIVLSKQNVLFVADRGDFDPDTGIEVPGELKMYDGFTGAFLGNLDHSGFSPFHPRGLVFGPDGLLYVSAVDFLAPNKGWVLRFDTKTNKLLDVFISNDDITDLHRPDGGLVFGPDGNLYVTSFRADVKDTDKILVVNRHTRKLIDKIDLYSMPLDSHAPLQRQSCLDRRGTINGPFDNDTGAPTGAFTGSVRRYNVRSKKFKEIVPPYKDGGPLGVPTFLTFGNTDPATLAYQCDQEESSDHHPTHPHPPHDESSDESST